MDKSVNFNQPKPDSVNLFVRLLAVHRNSIFSFILSMVHNWSDAEDIMQDTAEVMWCKFADNQPKMVRQPQNCSREWVLAREMVSSS